MTNFRQIDPAKLAAMLGMNAADDAPHPRDPATQARMLMDAAAAWSVPCSYECGMLLKPRVGGTWKQSLGIVMVQSVFAPIVIPPTGEDVRVVCMNLTFLTVSDDGVVYERYGHSRDFELYTGPIDGLR